MKIAVLMGGTSDERDVSLSSGVQVAAALRDAGHDVVAVDTTRGALTASEERLLRESGVNALPPTKQALDLLQSGDTTALTEAPEVKDADVFFLALHGGQGEDGTLQALLDLTSVPYTGSGHLASALAMDKDLSKHLFLAAQVPTAPWTMAPKRGTGDWGLGTGENFASYVERTLGLPVVVKPSKQGSTVGLSVVKKIEDLDSAIEEAFKYDDEVMVEKFVPGRELTVGILGDVALPVGEIIPVHEIYDYECKYTAGMAKEIFPADLTEHETRTVQDLARRAFHALKLRGYARIDFRMSPDGVFYCLEANTLPGMTALSLIPQAAAAAGMSFPELCERIVQLAVHDRGAK